MTLRRAFLVTTLLGLASVSSFVQAQQGAAAPSPVDVVKIMSFSCSVCLAAEAQDKPIAAAVRAQGGRFVWAPVPTHPEDKVGARERTYYAARDLNAQLGEAVKTSLYKGSQEQNLPLFDQIQVSSWVLRDLSEHEALLPTLFEKARSQDSAQALGRAIRLAMGAGVQDLPAYLLIQDGKVVANFDPRHPQATGLTALRELVLAKVAELNKTKP